MTLVAFQTALADLTASPELARAVRAGSARLQALYPLTDTEAARLAAVVNSPGMTANCMLYRANRLAPVALNLPATCTALGAKLEPLLSAYWASTPTTDVHFLIEAARFARYVETQPRLPKGARTALRHELAVVEIKLRASNGLRSLSAFIAPTMH